jgi:hypothetical protein
MIAFFGPKKEFLVKVENRKVLRFFTYIISTLFLLNFINIIGIHVFKIHHGIILNIFNFLDFNHEENLPTFYSSIAIFFASCLVFYITFYKKNKGDNYLFWGFLAFVFLFLALDENCKIHEFIGGYIEDHYFSKGAPIYLNFKWILPYSVFAILFALLSLKFVFSLPRVTMVMFIVSGSVYCSGAIACEVLESIYISAFGGEGIGYALFYTFEETLEMVGIAMFIYSLIFYISSLKEDSKEVKSTKTFETYLSDNVLK